MSVYDVIVVGLGAMGSGVCRSLAKRGVRVLGLERFDIPHSMGSSHGFSRMTRMAYYEHPDYVPLLKSADRMWHEIEAAGGQKLIYVTGGLYMGPAEGELVGGSLRSAREHGLACELLESGELKRRFPQFRMPGDFVGMLERHAGFIVPEKAIATAAMLALREGAELHGREEALEWEADGKGVKVKTNAGTYEAGQIIFCGGAWSGRLVRDLGVKLLVTRQMMAWVWPKKPEMFDISRLPVWAIDRLDGTIHYGFPMTLESPGLKLAHHGPARETEADEVAREKMAEDVQSIRPVLSEKIPDADGAILSMRVCLYTNSPDHHFIIDRHPKYERVLFGCGFSGHGFKFAPVVGEALAEMAIEGKTGHPVEFLGLSRFKKG